jgi:diguanylate cyclase (GGDEF)-like protein
MAVNQPITLPKRDEDFQDWDELRPQSGHARNAEQQLMHELTGMCFDRLAARFHCKRLERHRERLKKRLGRDTGVQVAALDYMVNIAPDEDSPLVIVDREQLKLLLQCSSIDSKTGLYNLLTFQNVMEKELALAKRKNTPLVIIMMDLDNFKEANDSRGHQYGDDVLRQVAAIFVDNLREMDIAGRYGGDEFIFGLPETELMPAIEIAERIRKQVQAHFSSDTSITISIGVATFPESGASLEKLIKAADRALYEAKTTGRNKLKAVRS